MGRPAAADHLAGLPRSLRRVRFARLVGQGSGGKVLLETEKLCAGPGQPFDEPRARIEQILARTDSPASMFNHCALTTAQDWTGRFRKIARPVLVIHGEEDPILPLANGRAIAAGIAGSDLVLPGTGHELPLSQVAAIVERVAAHVERSK